MTSQLFYLSDYIAMSQTLTDADTAAAGANGILVIDADYTITSPTALTSPLVMAGGGRIATGSNALTANSFSGDFAMLTAGAGDTGAITFLAPNGPIKEIWFSPPGITVSAGVLLDSLPVWNRFRNSCLLPGTCFEAAPLPHHTASYNKFNFDVVDQQTLRVTGATFDSTVKIQGKRTTILGPIVVSGQLMLTVSSGGFVVGDQLTDSVNTGGYVIDFVAGSLNYLTIATEFQFVPAVNDTISGASGGSATVNYVSYMIATGIEVGNGSDIVRFASWDVARVSSCVVNFSWGAFGRNKQSGDGPTYIPTYAAGNCKIQDCTFSNMFSQAALERDFVLWPGDGEEYFVSENLFANYHADAMSYLEQLYMVNCTANTLLHADIERGANGVKLILDNRTHVGVGQTIKDVTVSPNTMGTIVFLDSDSDLTTVVAIVATMDFSSSAHGNVVPWKAGHSFTTTGAGFGNGSGTINASQVPQANISIDYQCQGNSNVGGLIAVSAVSGLPYLWYYSDIDGNRNTDRRHSFVGVRFRVDDGATSDGYGLTHLASCDLFNWSSNSSADSTTRAMYVIATSGDVTIPPGTTSVAFFPPGNSNVNLIFPAYPINGQEISVVNGTAHTITINPQSANILNPDNFTGIPGMLVGRLGFTAIYVLNHTKWFGF